MFSYAHINYDMLISSMSTGKELPFSDSVSFETGLAFGGIPYLTKFTGFRNYNLYNIRGTQYFNYPTIFGNKVFFIENQPNRP